MDVKINIASFEEGFELQRLVLLAAQKRDFKVSDLSGDDRIDKIVNIAISVIADKEIYAALWPCLARCLYKGERITRSTFDDVEARKDFIPVSAKCIEVNLEPFIDGLLSAWKMLFSSPSTVQGLK